MLFGNENKASDHIQQFIKDEEYITSNLFTIKARANERNMLCQHVAFVCTPCWAMLHDVGICCVQFETSQTFCPTYANISLVTDEPGGCIPT